jgi:hypothetical protein
MTPGKIFAPFYTLGSRLTRTIGLFRLGSSDLPEILSWRDSKLKLFKETDVSQSESLEHLSDVELRKLPSKLCLILGIMTNIVSTISIVSSTQEPDALIMY